MNVLVLDPILDFFFQKSRLFFVFKILDIDECQYPEIIAECPSGCENTPGSYNCLEKPIEAEEESRKENEIPNEEDDESDNDVNRQVHHKQEVHQRHEDEIETNEIPTTHEEKAGQDCADGFKRDEYGECVGMLKLLIKLVKK